MIQVVSAFTTFLLASFLGIASVCAQAPKIATVRITDIYQRLDATQKLQESIKQQQEAINQDPRVAALQNMVQELDKMSKNVTATAKNMTSEQLRQAKEDYDSKTENARALERNFNEFRTAKLAEINKNYVSETKKALKHIQQIASQVAVQQGYEIVFEASGNSSTSVPALVYVKQPNDITPDVIKALGNTIKPANP